MKFFDCHLPVSVQWDLFFTAPFSIPNLLQNIKLKSERKKITFFEKKIYIPSSFECISNEFQKIMENIKYTLNANFNITYSH